MQGIEMSVKPPPTPPIRRVITGHDHNKRSVVKIDDLASNHNWEEMVNRTLVWSSDEMPIEIWSNTDFGARQIGLQPSGRGTLIYCIDILPGNDTAINLTDTLDYIICLSGQIDVKIDASSTINLKAGENKENASVGLLVYPNLMAADILLYKATHVPVGEDQKQHLELTRDIAKKFNNDFKCGEYFPIVEPLIPKEVSRVMSLRDGRKKMSKSEDSDQSRINLTDDKDLINQKIKKAKTDNDPIPTEVGGLKNRHEAANLISIYASINSISLDEVLKKFGGKNFSTFKGNLSESIVEKICPIGKEINKLLKDKNYLNGILEMGAKKADLVAKTNLKEIYEIIGLTKFT